MTTENKRRLKRLPLWALVGLLLLAVTAAGLWRWRSSASQTNIEYETVPITKGDVSSRVSATGTLDAVTKITVGSEISGIIAQLYVDYNTRVDKGQALAQLDPSTFQTQVDQQTASVNNATAQYHNQIANEDNAEANIRSADASLEGAKARFETARAAVANAQAGVRSAKATVEKAKADLTQAQTNYDRYKTLLQRDLVARSERDLAYTQYLDARATLAQVSSGVDAAEANLRSAHANLRAAEADVDAARMRRDAAVAQRNAAAAQVRAATAQVQQAQANLAQAKVNLGRTTIRSPIKGIVLDRKVTMGQTVAASFQAPDLFTLAENLDQMQVQTSVDEADIGRVRQGAHATFTVDAWPNVKFEGKVTEVRQAPVTVQNVVTYTVILTTPNPEQKLKPGMTATVSVDDETKRDVLLIPNAALRFKAPADQPKNSPSGTPSGSASGKSSGERRAENDTRGGRERAKEDGPRPVRVFTLDPTDSKKLVPHLVTLGITDGTVTEIVKSDLKEGDAIVVGGGDAASPSKSKAGGGRPPRMF